MLAQMQRAIVFIRLPETKGRRPYTPLPCICIFVPEERPQQGNPLCNRWCDYLSMSVSLQQLRSLAFLFSSQPRNSSISRFFLCHPSLPYFHNMPLCE